MPRTRSRTAHSQPAFTLVELMIVCVVIALLLGILVPVLSRAYKTALATADSALIHQISMGCETYQLAFNAYPTSTWAESTSTLVPRPTGWWPPPAFQASTSPSGKTIADTLALTGAGKVYASLSGFNTIGTAAPASVGCEDPVPANWLYPCGQLTYRGILVPEVAGSFTEKQPPYGPYYLASAKQQGKATTIVWNNLQAQQEVFTSRFERADIPTTTAALLNPVAEAGAPILYYLANSTPRDTDANGTIDSWDIYDYADNYLITDPPQTPPAPTEAILPPNTVVATDRWRHPLYAPSDGKTATNAIYDSVTTNNFSTLKDQYFGITRPFTKGGANPIVYPTVPYNANTFILISPGSDGRYFTADDITNYR